MSSDSGSAAQDSAMHDVAAANSNAQTAAPSSTAAVAVPTGAPSGTSTAAGTGLPPPPPTSSAAPSPLPLGVLAEELGPGAPPPLLPDGTVDDDALIEAALKEDHKEEEEEQGDEGTEGEEVEAVPATHELTPLERAAAASGSSRPPAPGESYITDTGEVRIKRAPRKKKVPDAASAAASAVTEEQLAAERKAAAERAEMLLTNLLKRTNEVMMRTMEGTPLPTAAAAAASSSSTKKKGSNAPRRKSEKEEDAEMLGEADLGAESDTLPNGAIQLRSQPSIVTGTMRAYQLEGLNWMIRLYHSGVSGILADEMGLGKTLQSISLLAYLRQFQKLNGPHLVLVPLSTLGNWHREFGRWCPSIRCFRFHGTKEERAEMVAQGQLHPDNYDVLLTSYEMSIREKAHINKVKWNFIIVDEAHRLKNEGSLLSQIVRIFSSRNRLLLTGTPLQNNLHELWALLNFLLPEIFASSADFDEMFSAAQADPNMSASLLTQLHKVLRPFMLRRLKAQVATDLPPKKETLLFVGMTEMQAKLYRGILEKDIECVLGKTNQKSRLMNMVMQLRKAANHPYLFEGVEDRTLPPYGDHLIYTSGKMSVLDKLLARFRAQGSRVLIFSQMTRTLDILEDYCLFRGFKYSRIDGSTGMEERELSMREFNAENSEKFVFLLSTRAGGLGINLNTADIVVLFDSDWNPQMDLQAMDRAHRIGQKKPVFVYRLITENTIEEKIIERAEIKLRLDAMVIQQGRAPVKGGAAGEAAAAANKKSAGGGMSSDEMSAMIRFGADRIFRQQGSTVTNEDIDNILQAAEQRTQEIQSKLGKHVGLLDLSLDGAPLPMTLASDDPSAELSAAEELERQLLQNMHDPLNLGSRRDRKGLTKSYNENAYFRDAMKAAAGGGAAGGADGAAGGAGGGAERRSHLPRPYKIPRMPDYQLFNSKRIQELSEKEREWYDKHMFDTSVPAIRGGLTEQEDEELRRLIDAGFSDWSWPDYIAFLDACKRYGGKDTERVIAALDGRRTREQVLKYHKAFFEHAPGTPGFKSALTAIARGEARVKKFAEFELLLERAMEAYPGRQDVMDRLPVPYTPLHKGKGFTLSEDRFLLYWTRTLGYGEWSKLRAVVRRDAEFRFDYFLKSRSLSQLSRRVDVLLRAMKKNATKAKGKRALAAEAAAAAAAAEGGNGALMAPASGSTRGIKRERPGSAAPGSLRPTPSPISFSFRPGGTPAPSDDTPLAFKRQALLHRGGPDGAGASAASSAIAAFADEEAYFAAQAHALARALLGADMMALLERIPPAEQDMPLAQRRTAIHLHTASTAPRNNAVSHPSLASFAPASPPSASAAAAAAAPVSMSDVANGVSLPSFNNADEEEEEEDDDDEHGDEDDEQEHDDDDGHGAAEEADEPDSKRQRL